MMKKRILTVIGARPQIIKAAALSRAVRTARSARGVPFSELVEEKILHTGQHYDDNMSGSFFAELGVPEPDYNLHVGSGSHGVQTAKMIEGIEQVLQAEHFDGLLLYGDTNSTLAGAVAAAKLRVPVFHVEAGLRSYNMSMPEEQNRIVCDHLSTVLFAPTRTAVENLRREGLTDSPARFADGQGRRVVLSGDVMYDNSMYFSSLARQRSTIMSDLRLQDRGFVLATIHRDNNTDSAPRLTAIISAMLTIANEHQMPIVFPMHPRTRKMLEVNLSTELREQLLRSPLIHIIPPASFFDIIELERHAAVVLTDSGGVQKEAFFFVTPTVILRPETEWVEIVEAGAGLLADADMARILSAFEKLNGQNVVFPHLFGDAHASELILEQILS